MLLASTERLPDSAELHLMLGISLRDAEDLDGAERAYRKALELRPGYAEALGNLGNVLQKQRRLDEAIENYRAAIAIRPEFFRQAASNLASMGRGRIWLKLSAARNYLSGT